MRQIETLDQCQHDASTGVLTINSSANDLTEMHLKVEGGYVAISVSYGPMEIALRPRLQELTRVLARLRPVEGLQTTRQVGTGQAYLSLGMSTDGMLLLRPTMVADATGHWGLNLALDDSVRAKLYEVLNVTPE